VVGFTKNWAHAQLHLIGALIPIKHTPLILTYGDHRPICRELETDKGNGESMEVIQGLEFSVQLFKEYNSSLYFIQDISRQTSSYIAHL
jgi:hypothetical protein